MSQKSKPWHNPRRKKAERRHFKRLQKKNGNRPQIDYLPPIDYEADSARPTDPR